MNKYIKNYFLSVTNTVMALLFPIITFPYVSRVLGPEKLGISNFAQSYGYYFIHIASFGINSYAIRELSKVRDDKAKADKISNEIFNINLFFSCLSTLLYFTGVLVIPKFRENFLIFAIYSVVVLSNFLSLEWLLQSYDDYLFATVRNLIIRIISLAAVFVLVNDEDDLAVYMLIASVCEMGSKFSALMYIRKNYTLLTIRKRFLNFKDHIRSLFILFVFRLVNGISANLDKLMIGFILVYESVGVYSAGVKIELMLCPIIETIGIVLFPKINISANSSQEEYKKNIKLNFDMILLLALPMSVGMFFASGRLIPLFSGDKYMGAIAVSKIMAITILLIPFNDLLGSKILLIHNRDKELLKCSSVVAVSNIVLNAVMIPLWGINGAALGSLISYVISIVMRLLYSRSSVRIRLFDKSFIKYACFTVPFAVLYFPLKDRINNDNLWFALYVLSCVAIYAAELIISKDPCYITIKDKIFKRREQ